MEGEVKHYAVVQQMNATQSQAGATSGTAAECPLGCEFES